MQFLDPNLDPGEHINMAYDAKICHMHLPQFDNNNFYLTGTESIFLGNCLCTVQVYSYIKKATKNRVCMH